MHHVSWGNLIYNLPNQESCHQRASQKFLKMRNPQECLQITQEHNLWKLMRILEVKNCEHNSITNERRMVVDKFVISFKSFKNVLPSNVWNTANWLSSKISVNWIHWTPVMIDVIWWQFLQIGDSVEEDEGEKLKRVIMSGDYSNKSFLISKTMVKYFEKK